MHNEEIWEEILRILVDLYDKEDIKKPTKLPPNIHNLQKLTEQYGKDSIKIVAEVPVYTGTYDPEQYDLNSIPYNKLLVLHDEEFNVEEITKCIKIMAVEAAEVIKRV